MTVGAHDDFFASEGAHEHQECRLRQVKVSEQRIYDSKLVPRKNKQVGFAVSGFQRAASRRLRGIFQSADGSCPNRDYAALFLPGGIERARRFCGNLILLAM